MSVDRRTFLGLAGLSALAVAGRGSVGALGADAGRQEPPSPGGRTARRWAMVVDPRKCLRDEGCTSCITACHRTHNVPAFRDRAHEIKWIWKEPFERAFASEEREYTPEALRAKPVLVLCNHCDNPPCVRVCPTQATWKRPDGIVMMDWHRCIGCRYCVAACPYGSRSFNWLDPRPHVPSFTLDFPTRTKGVVEKCTFCEERLAAGRLPACVEACRETALIVGDLDDPNSEVRDLLKRRYSLRRRPELGTRPRVYYAV